MNMEATPSYRAGDRARLVELPSTDMPAPDGQRKIKLGDIVVVTEIKGEYLHYKVAGAEDHGIKTTRFVPAGDGDSNAGHPCTCPPENFALNGRGCVCGGF